MRVRLAVLGLLLFAAMGVTPSAGRAAVGTVTVTNTIIEASAYRARAINQYTIAWTSSAGGAVSANPFSVTQGHIQSVKFVPASGGTQPSDLYDATLKDADGIDILNAQAANLSNSVGAYFQFNPPFYFPGSASSQTLDLVIANAGNAKSGSVILWVQ